jgi:hypothetical protein
LFNEFIQFLLDERGEVQVVLLNPLGLIFTDCDVLPFHGVYYAGHVYKCIGTVGLWANNKKVQKDEDGVDESLRDSFAHQKYRFLGTLYPRPTRSRWSLLEDGGLAPAFS